MPLADKNERAGEDKPAELTDGGVRKISVAGHRIDSRDLFIATREIIITHGSDVYRLRLTGQNKLILTK
jgi:hemin uptake protein HemP